MEVTRKKFIHYTTVHEHCDSDQQRKYRDHDKSPDASVESETFHMPSNIPESRFSDEDKNFLVTRGESIRHRYGDKYIGSRWKSPDR